MTDFFIERRDSFDMYVMQNDIEVMYILVGDWFYEYDLCDSVTLKKLCRIKSGTEGLISRFVKIFFFDENKEISIRNPWFSSPIFTHLGKTYKIVSKSLTYTKIYENDDLVLEMINLQHNTLYKGRVKVTVYKSDDLVFLLSLLIGFCSDFSWSD